VAYVHTLGSTEPDLRLWEIGNSAKDLDWSPDGEKIALRQDYHLVILDAGVANQDPVVLDVSPSPRSLAWSPDSQWFAVSTLSWKGVLKPPYDNVKYDIGRIPATGQGLTYLESFTSRLDKSVFRRVLSWTP
jgi:dipeptidyl aminopeptidase/acylaminoacyl peptidase